MSNEQLTPEEILDLEDRISHYAANEYRALIKGIDDFLSERQAQYLLSLIQKDQQEQPAMSAEEFLPKNKNGKYSRNEFVSGAEAYAQHYHESQSKAEREEIEGYLKSEIERLEILHEKKTRSREKSAHEIVPARLVNEQIKAFQRVINYLKKHQ